MGIYSFTQAGGSTIGFVAGGVLTDAIGWPAIFLINVPIGLAVGYFGLRLLPHHASGNSATPGGLDVFGAVLVTGGLSAGVFAIVRAGSPGSATTLVAAGSSVLLIVGFLFRQAYARTPLVPFRLISRPWLLKANATMALLFATGMGFQFLNALFVQRVMGYDALGTGLAFIPTPLAIGVVSLFIAPRLTNRFGPRTVLILGESAFVIGLILLSRLPVHPSYWAGMLPALLVMGLGVGVAIPSMIMLAMAGADPSEAGLVSGVGNTSQQAGGAIGVAVLAAVAAARTRADSALPATEALRNGYSTAFLVAAAFVTLSLILAAILLRRPPRQPASDAPAHQPTPILQDPRSIQTQ
jgi:MFS family permease